jgi:tight adherence protein C
MANIFYLMSMMAMFVAILFAAYNVLPIKEGPVGARRMPLRRVDLSRVDSIVFKWGYYLTTPFAPFFRWITWDSYRRKETIELQRAGLGEGMKVVQLFVLKTIAAIVIPLVVSQIFTLFTNPFMFLVAAFGGWVVPDKLVADMRKKRERRIVRTLPGAVDVLSLSVEAGLEFLTAMQRLVERGGIGPLRDELATILSDIRLGKTRSEAMKAFAERVEIPEVSSFVSVLVQADVLGTSIGPVLQQQAERMRVERFQRAEKAGATASQKILFPLVLFIFPAVLIVVIGPVVLQFIYGGR